MCCFSRARTGFGGGSRLTRQGKEESHLSRLMSSSQTDFNADYPTSGEGAGGSQAGEQAGTHMLQASAPPQRVTGAGNDVKVDEHSSGSAEQLQMAADSLARVNSIANLAKTSEEKSITRSLSKSPSGRYRLPAVLRRSR